MYYIVPAEDQSAGGFRIPTGLFVKMPLEDNTVKDVLQPLARWLNVPSRECKTKADYVRCINLQLSVLPMSAALARWPEMDPVSEGFKEAWEFEAAIKRIATLVTTVHAQTLEFIPHICKILDDLRAAKRTAEDQGRSERYRKMRKERELPKWWEARLWSKPEGSYYLINVKTVDQGHDGYCSGVEEDELEEVESSREAIVYYLPQDGWTPMDLNEKMDWKMNLDGHCCCGAATLYSVTSWMKMS